MKNKVNIIEESKNYFFKFVEPLIQSQFPHYLEKITAGYFGHGSQCLGFDDEISEIILNEMREAIGILFPFINIECDQFWQIAYELNETILDPEIKAVGVWYRVSS